MENEEIDQNFDAARVYVCLSLPVQLDGLVSTVCCFVSLNTATARA